MTAQSDAARRKQHDSALRTPGVRTIDRPLPGGGSFPLRYTRTGPAGSPPVLVLPGGPGLASVLPYRPLRARATKLGLDLVMMEHRGVGLSRTDSQGTDLPRSAVTIGETIDDAAAILDAEGLDQVLVYGTSYGSYLAQGFGARHPDRVAAMILDAAMLDAHGDALSARLLSSLYWHGTPETRTQADRLRSLVEGGAVPATAMFPVQLLHEFGGPRLVDRMLTLLEADRGHRAWEWIDRLGTGEVMTPRPFLMEFDLVGQIAFRELNYAAAAADTPLQLSSTFATAAAGFAPFAGEPFALRDEVATFTWPVATISGDRDIRAPRSVSDEIVALAPNAALVPIARHGHSALDTQSGLALSMMRHVTTWLQDTPPAARTIDAARLPQDLAGGPTMLGKLVAGRLRLAQLLPPRFS